MKKTFSIKSAWYGLIALVTLLPFLLLLPWIVRESHSLMLENAIEKEDLHIDRIKGEVQNETKRLISLLENKSDSFAYALENGRDINLLLKLVEAILLREKSIHAVFILGTDARLIAGMDKDPITGRTRKILPPEKPHADEFDKDSPRVAIPLMGRNYIGSPAMHEGVWNFDIAEPIGQRESPAGALVASIVVEKLWEEIGARLSRPEVDTYIIDRGGTLLSWPPPGAIYKQGDLLTKLRIVRSLIVSERYVHSGSYMGLKGAPVFGVGAQIEILNWAVISEIPEEVITGPIYRFLLITITLGTLFVIFFGGLGFRLANGMLAPIVSMSKSFKKAEAGDYSRSDATSSIKEINQLIDGFDHMIGNIDKRAKTLLMISQCNQALILSQNEQVLLEDICKIIVNTGGYRMAWAGYTQHDEGKSVRPMAYAGVDEGYIESLNITWAATERGKGPTGVAIRTGAPCVAREMRNEPRFKPWRKKAEESGYSSSAAIPLMLDNRALGAINIYSGQPHAFNKEEMKILEELAGNLAFGIRTLRMNAARRKAEKLSIRLGRILDESVNEIYIVDAHTLRFLQVNQGACKNLGYTFDEIKELTPLDIAPEFTEKTFLELIKPLRKKEAEVISFNTTHKRKDGSLYPAEVRLQYYDSETPPLFAAIIQDITERKLAEKEIEHQKTMFESIFNGVADAIVFTDTERKIVTLNPGFTRILGYNPRDIIGEETGVFYESWEVYKKMGEERYNLSAQEKLKPYVVSYKRKDGTLFPGETLGSIVRNKSGEIIGFLGVIRDITERKLAEETLRNIASGVSSEAGETFYENLVLHLATLLGAEYAFINELVDSKTARTLAFCAHGKIIDNVTYNLADTPCANVAGHGACVYPSDVRRHFPRDTMLVDMSVESYIGKPLLGSTGRCLGLIAIMDNKPMENIEHMESILEIFNARAAAEIERMGANEALRESEERFSKAFHSSPNAIAITSLEDGTIMEVNEGFERILGFTREDVLGKPTLELGLWRNPEDRTRFTRLLEENGKVANIEMELITKSGEIVICQLSAELIDLSGRACLISTTRDITDYKRAEKKLRESELWLQSIYSSLEEAVIVATAERKLMSINSACIKMFGYSFEELENKSTAVLHVDHDHYVEFGLRIKKAFDKGESADFEYELKRKNGEIFPTEHTVSLLKNSEGETIGIISAVRDITERKKAEEALRESYRLLEFSQRVANLGSYALDVLSGTWSSSEVLDKIFGITDEGFTRNVEGWHAIIHPGHKEEMQNYFASHVLAGRNKFDKEYRIVRLDDGEERWVHGIGELVLDENQNPVKMIGTIQDITERKKTEQELAKHRDHLEELVEARTNELTSVNKELESFAYSVSHDLRAPLRAIDGYSKALLEDYTAKVDEVGKNYLNRVCAATLRMSQLIDDLLTLSRVTRSEMTEGRVDLGKLARDVADELRKEEPERKVKLSIESDMIANGDLRLLRVVLYNLVSNAWKFTGKRSGASIEFGSTIRDGKKVYFVRDNGVGFDMKYVGKLFGAFQRLHTMSQFPGTGIGLATVQRIIHRHGGRVWAEGEVDKGATFYFTL